MLKKLIDGTLKVLGLVIAVLLVIAFGKFVFSYTLSGQQTNVHAGVPSTHYLDPDSNLSRQQWFRNCGTWDAKVEPWGKKGLQCHAPSRSETYIDQLRVE
jgi:hypothetical protein